MTLKRGSIWKRMQFNLNSNYGVGKLVSKWLPNKWILKCSFSANKLGKAPKLNNTCFLAYFYQKTEYITSFMMINMRRKGRQKLHNWNCQKYWQKIINICTYIKYKGRLLKEYYIMNVLHYYIFVQHRKRLAIAAFLHLLETTAAKKCLESLLFWTSVPQDSQALQWNLD